MDKAKKENCLRSFTPPPKVGYPAFQLPSGPLDIEIGCGVGLHPILYSKLNPERLLVAIEHTREKFQKFERRYKNNGSPDNVLPIHANAISWVSEQLPENSVDRFYFLYPNPNPKPGDLNKRWHAMPFMQKVLSILKKNGELILATNEEFYKEEAKDFFSEVWELELIKENILTKDFSGRTHFERKYLKGNQNCFELIWKK